MTFLLLGKMDAGMDRFFLFSPAGNLNSCVSIKPWEPVEQLKLMTIAPLKMKRKRPVYISHLLSHSVDFFSQPFTLNI